MISTPPCWLGSDARPLYSGESFGVMGILNITPDSFYDGGRHTQKPVEDLCHLLEEGADIIDIGAESTRPGAQPVDCRTELARLEPVLQAINPRAVKISVDTRHAGVAARVLELGTAVINDVSGCADPALVEVLAQYKPGYVLTHSAGNTVNMGTTPIYRDVVEEVKKFFEKKLNFLVAAGLPEDRIILDPGIGFDKNTEHNLALLANIAKLEIFQRPLLAALSMKSFFGGVLGIPLQERGDVTATASALLWQKGVAWHRVHEVKKVRRALLLAKALATGEQPQADTGY